MKLRKKISRILLTIFLIVVLFGAGGAMYWNSKTYPASGVALQALQSDAQVTVTQQDGFITFEPANMRTPIGFVFYPGAGVDYRAYAPVLHQIVAHGYFVALVPVPLNLAFFNINAAKQVIELYPTIQHWAVGGHSLGGIAAASFASKNPNKLDGVVFWASYPAGIFLTNATINVLSIYGTNDKAGMEPFDKSRTQLPADTQFVVIEGGNHAQFGSYGPQAGDKIATISPEEQWTQITEATVLFLDSLSK